MTKGFQHQQPPTNFNTSKSEPKPQHGRKPDEACLKITERRSFAPKPGH